MELTKFLHLINYLFVLLKFLINYLILLTLPTNFTLSNLIMF